MLENNMKVINKKKLIIAISLASSALLINEAVNAATIDINYAISPQQQNHEISPLIYGINQRMPMLGNENFSFYRFGGNRTTAYNWENNWSSAGADWMHFNDDYLILDGSDQTQPAVSYTTFLDQEVKNNAKSLLTLQMAGYVAADGDGAVSEAEAPPSSRWIPVYPRKNAPFADTPDLNDNAVYTDELVNYMVQRYGRADQGGVWAWSLDNEPALWNTSHSRMRNGTAVGIKELVELGIATASAAKDVDSSAKIFGPALFGMAAYVNLNQKDDWNSNYASIYKWYVDYYLDKMREASDTKGMRLLDVMDFHYYSEATGDHRVTQANSDTRKDQEARLQAPRTLWDAGYVENSWIGTWMTDYLPVIPSIQNSINTYYPGTEMAFTEYNFGGGNDISGGVTQVDVLGVFGKLDVFAANYWLEHSDEDKYISSAFRLFRNYDGANSTFGDISVDAQMSDKENSSIYAATDSASGDLHVIVLNKSLDDDLHGTFQIVGDQQYDQAKVYALSANSTEIQYKGDINVSNNSFDYSLPQVSAYHLVLKPGTDNGSSDSQTPPDNGGESDNDSGDNGGSTDNGNTDNGDSGGSDTGDNGTDNDNSSGSDNSSDNNTDNGNTGNDSSDEDQNNNDSSGQQNGDSQEDGSTTTTSPETPKRSVSVGTVNPLMLLGLSFLFIARRRR
jgi:hypothetical protein